jgi:hypothetical protein
MPPWMSTKHVSRRPFKRYFSDLELRGWVSIVQVLGTCMTSAKGLGQYSSGI